MPTAYRDAINRALVNISHEGCLHTEDGMTALEARKDEAVLLALIDPTSHTVRRLRHMDTKSPVVRAVIDTFCWLGEGLPIQEAADHLGMRTMESLINRNLGRPAPGILLPNNQPSVFQIPIDLIREIRSSYGALTGFTTRDNFYHASPGARWQAMNDDDRLAMIATELDDYLKSEGRAAGDVQLLKVTQNRYALPIRVVVGFGQEVPMHSRPQLMRRFEERLRQRVEPELELVADRVKDQSPLRRLS